ncbi:hypothetical protein [Saccharothrix sp. HUAS TT1]
MTSRPTEEQERADAAARRVRQDRVRALSGEGRERYAGLLDRLSQ